MSLLSRWAQRTRIQSLCDFWQKMSLNNYFRAKVLYLGGSPGLVVMGGDWCSESRVFEKINEKGPFEKGFYVTLDTLLLLDIVILIDWRIKTEFIFDIALFSINWM